MTLEVGGFTWTGDGQQLLALGREVCTALDANRSAADVITDISEQNAWPPAKGGYFMGAALGRYCPHHRDRVMREGGRLPG